MAGDRQKDGNPTQFADQGRFHRPSGRFAVVSTHGGIYGGSKNSKNQQTDEEFLRFMQNNESRKMKVRFFGNGEAEIETDTPEEAKEARARLRK